MVIVCLLFLSFFISFSLQKAETSLKTKRKNEDKLASFVTPIKANLEHIYIYMWRGGVDVYGGGEVCVCGEGGKACRLLVVYGPWLNKKCAVLQGEWHSSQTYPKHAFKSYPNRAKKRPGWLLAIQAATWTYFEPQSGHSFGYLVGIPSFPKLDDGVLLKRMLGPQIMAPILSLAILRSRFASLWTHTATSGRNLDSKQLNIEETKQIEQTMRKTSK